MIDNKEEKKTFAQSIEDLGDTSFSRSVKSWLERLQKSMDTVTEWTLSNDIIDITEDAQNKCGCQWKHWMGGPYHRIKLIFNDGTEIYGKSLYYKEWDIKEDNKENWGYIWIRQRKEAIDGTNSYK